MRTTTQRFCEKVRLPRGDGGCWEWTAGKFSEGYGAFKVGGRLCKAHRISYEMFVRPLEGEITLDHLCRNRACVNPAHLEPVTIRENVLRGDGPPARRARQRHCHRGHPFDDANTYRSPTTGYRRCRQCHRVEQLAKYHRIKAKKK